MDTQIEQPTQPLLVANRRLRALQEAARQQRASSTCAPLQSARSVNAAQVIVSNLPSHLGWRNASVTHLLRKPEQTPVNPATLLPLTKPTTAETHISQATPTSKTVRVFHDVALGILRHDLAAPGRVWLLLRHIDTTGRGWIELSAARQQLTDKESSLRICGWRQLRNLIRQGQGVFWERGKSRIWLHSVAKVAAAVDVSHLSGRPVAVPIQALLKGIGHVRAYLYATFHSRRAVTSPISRESLAKISSVATRTQRIYEQRSGVQADTNYALGPSWTAAANRERSWVSGHATFKFIDHRGEHGKPGHKYIAWRLPNSYRGSLCRTPNGRKKHLNHSLKDLVKQRAQGNSSMQCKRVFFKDSTTFADFGRKQTEGTTSPNDARTCFWPAPSSLAHIETVARVWYAS